MDIYYINLDRRADRRTFMEAQFTALGLTAQRIAAISDDQLSPDQIDRYCNPNRGGRLYPRALSCRLSHFAAMQAVVASGAPRALVLEDDAILSHRLPAFLAAFERDPEDCDLLRLETSFRGIRSHAAERTLAGVELLRPYSWEAGAAGYIISSRAAGLMLASPNMRLRNDFDLFNPFGRFGRRRSALQASPALVVQEHLARRGDLRLGSDIKKSNRLTIAVPAWRRAAAEIRLLFEREIVTGGQSALHQLLGARKRHVPFLQ